MLTMTAVSVDRRRSFCGAPLPGKLEKALTVADRYLEAEAANPLSARCFRPSMEQSGRFGVHRETFRSDFEWRPVSEGAASG